MSKVFIDMVDEEGNVEEVIPLDTTLLDAADFLVRSFMFANEWDTDINYEFYMENDWRIGVEFTFPRDHRVYTDLSDIEEMLFGIAAEIYQTRGILVDVSAVFVNID